MEQLFTARREQSGTGKKRTEQLFTTGRDRDQAEDANRRNGETAKKAVSCRGRQREMKTEIEDSSSGDESLGRNNKAPSMGLRRRIPPASVRWREYSQRL